MSFDFSTFIAHAKEQARRDLEVAQKAVDTFGEAVIGNSQTLAPVATGALKASGTTEPAKMDGTKISKTIGHNTDYAAAVHENLEARHAVGQAKYLSTALAQAKDKFAPYVADKIKAAKG